MFTHNHKAKIRLPSSILGAKFNIVAAQTSGISHHTLSLINNLLRRHLQLVLHVNLTRRDERVNPRLLRPPHRLPRPLNIPLVAPREAADDGDMIGVGTPDLAGDQLNCVEVGVRGGGESGLYYVDAEPGELPGYVELLLGSHGGPGRLLAVAEGGVEHADVLGIGDVVGDVFGTSKGAADYGGGGGGGSEVQRAEKKGRVGGQWVGERHSNWVAGNAKGGSHCCKCRA